MRMPILKSNASPSKIIQRTFSGLHLWRRVANLFLFADTAEEDALGDKIADWGGAGLRTRNKNKRQRNLVLARAI